MLSANIEDSDQTPHNVASDLGLHCLSVTLVGFPGMNGLKYAPVQMEGATLPLKVYPFT